MNEIRDHDQLSWAAELITADKEFAFQTNEKSKPLAAPLLATQAPAFQNESRKREPPDYKHALGKSSIPAITHRNGIISYVNDVFCRISRNTAGELIGQDHRVINS